MKIGRMVVPSDVADALAKGDMVYYKAAGNEPTSYDTYTKLLMHCDVAKATSVLAATGQTITYGGVSDCNTDQKKFGAMSLYLNAAVVVTVPNSTDWDFGTGNFTIGYWEYRTTVVASGCSIARDNSAVYSPFLIGWQNAGSAAIITYLTSDGANFDIASGKSMGTSTLNTWIHYAIVRNGTTFRTYQNGVQTDSWTSAASIYPGASALQFGKGQTSYFGGYLDEIRVSKGIARWTSAFGSVAPTAYADSDVSSGTKTKVTAPINDLIDGMTVVISGTTGAAYDGTYVISNVTGTTFDIVKAFGSNPAAKGTWSSLPQEAYPYLPASCPGGGVAGAVINVGWKRLPIGTTGQTLKVSADGIPAWTT